MRSFSASCIKKWDRNWPNRFAEDALAQAFAVLDPSQYLVSVQIPLRFGTDQPEPDIQVLRGSLRSRRAMPTADEALLLIEVSDTTYTFDHSVKGLAYASAGIPQFWLVDHNKRRVEVYTRPEMDGYAEVRIFEFGDLLPPAFDGAPAVAVESLFQTG